MRRRNASATVTTEGILVTSTMSTDASRVEAQRNQPRSLEYLEASGAASYADPEKNRPLRTKVSFGPSAPCNPPTFKYVIRAGACALHLQPGLLLLEYSNVEIRIRIVGDSGTEEQSCTPSWRREFSSDGRITPPRFVPWKGLCSMDPRCSAR